MKNNIKIILMFLMILLITSCADKINVSNCISNAEVAGFWHGLWHGIIAPFAFICSLFSDNVAVWAVNNNGGWYTFGFVLGIGGLISYRPGKY